MTESDPARRQVASAELEMRMIGRDTVIKNTFNNETFVFSGAPDESGHLGFDVVLGEGGTGGGNALIHVHPLADETFAVSSGRLKVIMAGKEHFVGAGETITVPRGTPHYFANASAEAMKATVSFFPPQQHLRFFRNFAMLTQQRPQWFSAKGDPKLLLIALVLDVYHDHLYLAGPPIWLQKTAFAILARAARWRGYALPVSPCTSDPN
ncbi:cupin domain-containing protein [Methylocystis sp. H62]|uniref:cupin domain-containing protein n=1 Tax=Methylocystis sp. H62 TaxID=2785789 RepID=UPI0018C2DE37|nr:cupin domain-containing protein [Methylocystis sp. H62]MBG0792438.1 cupin domain-containing protein [Methylocystis sp. H62]MBG0792912.1 cupin domain-containing protein [Methylocystis sp. H62]